MVFDPGLLDSARTTARKTPGCRADESQVTIATISPQPRITPRLHPGYTLHTFVIPNAGEESGDFSLHSNDSKK
jgi:hypothetical protein